MIEEIRPSDVLKNCRVTLGVPGDEPKLDDVLLSGLLRRCAGIRCPCSRTALRTALVESLGYLVDDNDTLPERLDNLIEDLIVGGDLLELSDVAIDDPKVKGTWVFAAPPSFVTRPGGTVFLTGIVPDQDSFLPASLSARIAYESTRRQITPNADENLAAVLLGLGLQELPESVWLKSPRAETADSHVEHYERLLAAQPPSGAINELEVLDSARKSTFYRGRWTKPGQHTGTFVARRPQEFGARLWCLVALEDGEPRRLLDLPRAGFRWRGCDAAWHLQMAIDHCLGQPQRYRRHSDDKITRFDFYSPLPEWSRRRLIILGKPCQSENSLLAYEIPNEEAEVEERFLQERLWLYRTGDCGNGE